MHPVPEVFPGAGSGFPWMKSEVCSWLSGWCFPTPGSHAFGKGRDFGDVEPEGVSKQLLKTQSGKRRSSQSDQVSKNTAVATPILNRLSAMKSSDLETCLP